MPSTLHYAHVAGVPGGQTLNGDTASGGNLDLHSTAHSTKGLVRISSDRVSVTGSFTLSTGAQAAMVTLDNTISNSNDNAHGIWAKPTFTGAGTAPVGIIAQPVFTPSAATISVATGFQCDAFAGPVSTKTITLLKGGASRIVYQDVAGAVTNGVTHEIAAPVIQGALKPGGQYGLDVNNQGAAGITSAIGIRVQAQSGATNNYVFDLPADATAVPNGGLATPANHSGRIPCTIGGTLRYIPYY